MLDIKLIRENRDLVKENIKKKFQDKKIDLVDKAYDLDIKIRENKQISDNLRKERNESSNLIGTLMREKNIDLANEKKEEVKQINEKLATLDKEQEVLEKELNEIMLVIPNIIDESVPIGKDDSENVELEKFGEPFVPDYEIPYHA